MAMGNWPATATGVEPKTGQERYVAPREVNCVVREVLVLGWIVVVSMNILEWRVRGVDEEVIFLVRVWRAVSSLSCLIY